MASVAAKSVSKVAHKSELKQKENVPLEFIPMEIGCGITQLKPCACGGDCPNCRNRSLGALANDKNNSQSNVQRKPLNATSTTKVSPSTAKGLHSPANPLKNEIQELMGSRFGYDFSQVRIHDGSEAATSAQSVNAKAYTVGRDIVFNSGQYSPDTREGQALLAHELAHVVQQNRGGSVPALLPESDLERSADAAENTFRNRKDVIKVAGASAPGLSREPISLRHHINPREMLDEEIRHEVTEIQEWLIAQIDSTPDYVRMERVLRILADETARRSRAPTTYAQASALLALAQRHATHTPPDLAAALSYATAVQTWIHSIVTRENVDRHFFGHGINYSTASILTDMASGAIDMLCRRIRSHPVSGRPMSTGIWNLYANEVRAAHDYLVILNDESTYESSEMMRGTERAGYIAGGIALAPIVIPLAIVGAVEAAPIIAGEAVLFGSIVADGASTAWVWTLMNPIQATMIAEFAFGVVLQIANDPEQFGEAMRSPEGQLFMAGEILMLVFHVQTTPPGGGTRVRTVNVETEIVSETSTTITVRVRSVTPAVDAPTASPTAPRVATPPVVEETPPVVPRTTTPPTTPHVEEAPPAAPRSATPPATEEAPPVAPRTTTLPTTPHTDEAPPPTSVPRTSTTADPETDTPTTATPSLSATVEPDLYAELTLPQLRRRARTDPEAMEALRLRYRAMSDGEVRRRARGRDDAMAASELERRTITDPASVGHGRFSRPEMETRLSEDLESARAGSGIPRRARTVTDPEMGRTEGGTIGVARTDAEGLEGRGFTGRSARAGGTPNPDTEFPPATDRETLPHTHDHAEQDIADQFAAAVRALDIPEDQINERLRGRTIWMLIEQEPCSPCARGIGHPELPDTEVGVLMRFSRAFPTLTIQIRNAMSSAVITLRGGEVVE